MPIPLSPRVPDAAEVAALDPQQVASMMLGQALMIEALQRQIEWFKRQLFGSKSERFAPQPELQQMHLGQVLGQVPLSPPDSVGQQRVAPAHAAQAAQRQRLRWRERAVLRRVEGTSAYDSSAQPRSAERGHRREDQSPPGAVAG